LTSRERILTVLRGEIPDCVPVCPDISNMVPCRLTGKPFWDIYVYKDPPLWKAHIDALKHFDVDGGFEICGFPGLFAGGAENPWERRIVHRWEDGSFATRQWNRETDAWGPRVVKHTEDNPPATNVLPESIGLPEVPDMSEPIEGVKEWPTGLDLWKLMRSELGEQGVLGMPSGASTCLLYGPEDILAYTDDPEPFYRRRDKMIERVTKRMEKIAALEEKPDLLFCGASGSLVWQSPAILRELALPVLKHVAKLAYDLGIPAAPRRSL
jgi:uroporphyrinogen decarboxylase